MLFFKTTLVILVPLLLCIKFRVSLLISTHKNKLRDFDSGGIKAVEKPGGNRFLLSLSLPNHENGTSLFRVLFSFIKIGSFQYTVPAHILLDLYYKVISSSFGGE